MVKRKKILFEVWKIIKRDNIQIIGFTEVREKMAESLSKELIAENFSNLGKN